MSKFTDEIKENLKDFVDPYKQHIKNVKQDISDKLYDLKNGYDNNTEFEGENNTQEHLPQPPNKKPKSKKNIIIGIVVILLLIGLMRNCSSDEETRNPSNDSGQTPSISDNSNNSNGSGIFNDTDDTEVVLELIAPHITYAREHNIKTIRFPKEEKALWQWINSYDDFTPKHLEYEENMFSGNYYKRTEDRSEYLYFGELKDNKPHGYGVLYKISSNTYSWYTDYDAKDNLYYNYDRYYIGHFSDGNFDGFGLMYSVEEKAYEAIMYHLTRDGGEAVDEAIFHYYTLWGNPVSYFGMFSNGEYSTGNYFGLWDLYELPDNHDITKTKYVIIELGEYSNGCRNGYGIEYWGEYLHYVGEFSNDKYNGEGTLYYFQSNQIEYDGEFRNNKRHGYGKSYSESGELIYEGEWENDDYK